MCRDIRVYYPYNQMEVVNMTMSIDIPNYERIDAMIYPIIELKKRLLVEAGELPGDIYSDIKDDLQILNDLISELRAKSERVQESCNEYEPSDREEHSTYFCNIQGIV